MTHTQNNAGKQWGILLKQNEFLFLYNILNRTVKDITNPLIYFKICKTNPFLHVVFVQHEIIIQ